MIPTLFSVPLALLSFSLSVGARSTPAVAAIQHLSPRAIYQGGWPLALAGSASTTCPSDTPVLCDSKSVNPSCCPSGQTCIFGSSVDANYCCPTSADCNTAVVNFPQCANTTWTMFKQYYGGYFCCPPDLIGVNPSAGTSGGLCEPHDQVVPSSLLATVYAQATPKPSATASPANATITGNPNQANPTAPSSSSHANNNNNNDPSGIAAWSNARKIALGVAVVVLVLVVLALVGLVRRRRSRMVVPYSAYNGSQYDEYGNLLPPPYGRTGYEPYRHANDGNNVTVNVVQGDLTH